MPNYDYLCDRCGKTFEVFQSMTAPRLETCPDESCGGAVKRLLGRGAGFLFKGAGFYATDYRSSSYREAAKKDSGGSEKPATAPASPAASASASCCGGGCNASPA